MRVHLCHCNSAWCVLERPVHSFVRPYLKSSKKWVDNLLARLAGFWAQLSVWKSSTLCKQASFISSMRESRGLCLILAQQPASTNKGNHLLEAGGWGQLHRAGEAAEVTEQGNRLQWAAEALLLPFAWKMRMTGPAQRAGCGVSHRDAQLYESMPF